MTQTRLAAAILAGGAATRFGGLPKGLIELRQGVTILGRLIDELAAAGLAEMIIVANNAEPYGGFGLPIVPDLRPGLGPLGGVEAALTDLRGRSDAVLFVPSDMPAVTARELRRLLDAFGQEGTRAVYARTGGSLSHHLCVVLDNSLLDAVSLALDAGRRRPADLWREIGAAPVDFEDEAPFFNVNTSDDLERWREQSG